MALLSMPMSRTDHLQIGLKIIDDPHPFVNQAPPTPGQPLENFILLGRSPLTSGRTSLANGR
jgi:hypothetical protein